MTPAERIVDRITDDVTKLFLCFGSGQTVPGNPIAEFLKDSPARFAMGVDVKEVVEFVINRVDDLRSDGNSGRTSVGFKERNNGKERW